MKVIEENKKQKGNEKSMSKSKKQPVCCIPDLESMKGFTIDEVREKGQNALMELVNHQTGEIIKLYVDSVLFGTELVKYVEE